MAFTRPKAAQIDFDITNITDPLIRLNSGETGSADKDVGIVIERGDDTNVAIIYDESADQFVLVNTTETGTTSGNVTISSYANLQAGAATFSGTINADGTGNSILVADTLRIAQSGSGLRMTNVGAFDNDGSDNFRIFGTNDLILAANGNTGTAVTIDSANQDVRIHNDLTADGNVTATGNLTVDTNTLFVNAANNRVGIGTASPAYQVEIENTSANALLVLDRTDGASTFIEGGASDSVIGSVGANDVKIAYNSVPVVTIGSGGAITTSGNITGGTLRADNFTTQNAFAIVGSDNNLIQDTTLSVDPASNYLGINQTSPEVTLHMTGEGAQTAQIRMEQYNDSADAPDVRTRRYRGTIASPSAVQAGDYLFRSNHEYYNGTSLLVGGAFAFDNTNNANRTQFSVAVDTDGTGADPAGNNGQFKIDGNDGGAITFNNAYKFPTSDGTVGQVFATDGAGNISFTDLSIGDLTVIGSTITTPSNADLTLDPGGTGNVVLKTSANFIQGSAHTISSEDATGTYKARQYLLWGETTDATETEIFVGGVTNARIPVGTNTTINYSVQVVARRTDATGESAAWELKALADSFSGTVANVGNVYEVIVARDDENWLVDARADDTNNSVGIYVTGVAGKTIRWVAEVETSEVSE